MKSSPFDNVSAPAGVGLVSRTPGGVPGDGDSTSPSLASNGALYFSSCATDITGDTDACYAYRSDGTLTHLDKAFLGTDILDWGGETTVSPDGSRLGFTTLVRLVAEDIDDSKDLYSLTLADGTMSRVSQTAEGSGMTGGEEFPNAADSPVWAPDSARMAFITQSTNLAPKNDYDDVFIKNIAGGPAVREGVGRTVHVVSWSPGGDSVAFDGEDENSLTDVDVDSNVYIAPAGGGTRWKFTSDGQSFDPAWSPDGSAIAFASNAALVAGDTNETSDVYV